jgi:hypothetical protein
MRFLSLKLVAVAFTALAIILPAKAEDNNVSQYLQEAMASLQKGEHRSAAIGFRYALHNLSQQKSPLDLPPGLVFNLALSTDRSHEKLSPAIWYKTYLMLYPTAPQASQVENRADVLIRAFETHVLKAATMLEGFFEELQKEVLASEHLSRQPEARQFITPFDQYVNNIEIDKKAIQQAIISIETARIAVGDVEGGLRQLQQWHIPITMDSDENLIKALSEARVVQKLPPNSALSEGDLLALLGYLTPDEAVHYDNGPGDLVDFMMKGGAISAVDAGKYTRGRENLSKQLVQINAEEIQKACQPSTRINLYLQLGFKLFELALYSHVQDPAHFASWKQPISGNQIGRPVLYTSDVNTLRDLALYRQSLNTLDVQCSLITKQP